jgi:hypothetical protein
MIHHLMITLELDLSRAIPRPVISLASPAIDCLTAS